MWRGFNIVMRIVSTAIGALMAVMGSIWILQGVNLAWGAMRRSFMEGDPHWAFYGTILAIVGVCQVIWSNTRQNTN